MSWWNFPIIWNFGVYPDPVGPYPKPDINIVAPVGTQFTAPASGTITSIDNSSFYGPSITVKFDNAPNSVAQYYAFNYLQQISGNLHEGQHVNVGDILGIGGGYLNNSGGTAAFAFSAGPAYGKGSGWSNNVIGTWINPKLDPTSFIKTLQSGGLVNPNTDILPLGSPLTGGILPSINLYSILGLPSQADLNNFFQRYMIIIVGVMLVLIGVLVMFFSSEAGQKTIQAGEQAAMAA